MAVAFDGSPAASVIQTLTSGRWETDGAERQSFTSAPAHELQRTVGGHTPQSDQHRQGRGYEIAHHCKFWRVNHPSLHVKIQIAVEKIVCAG